MRNVEIVSQEPVEVVDSPFENSRILASIKEYVNENPTISGSGLPKIVQQSTSHMPNHEWEQEDDEPDAVGLYLREISKIPRLTREEELALARRIQSGLILQNDIDDGMAARDIFIRANLRLVVSVAKRYIDCSVPFLDLIQEGNLGLMKAVKKFDPERGNGFSAYAVWDIRHAIIRAIPEQERLIRLPVHLSEAINRMHWTKDVLTQELHRVPNDEEIACGLGITTKKLMALRGIDYPIELDTPVGDEEEENTLGDFLEDTETESPPEYALTQDEHAILINGIALLSPRQSEAIQTGFGFIDGESHDNVEVGRIMGIATEPARQLKIKGLKYLWGRFIDYVQSNNHSAHTEKGGTHIAHNSATEPSSFEEIRKIMAKHKEDRQWKSHKNSTIIPARHTTITTPAC